MLVLILDIVLHIIYFIFFRHFNLEAIAVKLYYGRLEQQGHHHNGDRATQ